MALIFKKNIGRGEKKNAIYKRCSMPLIVEISYLKPIMKEE